MSAADRKKQVVRTHAGARMQQRYGIELTVDQVKALQAKLRAGAGVLLERQDNGRYQGDRRLINFAGQDIIVVWNQKIDRIITVLPKGANQKLRRPPARHPRGKRPRISETEDIENGQ